MIGMLSMIDKGKHVTPQTLADQFGVHVRSIFRDLEALISDFPIYSDEEVNSYRFTEGYDVRAASWVTLRSCPGYGMLTNYKLN